MVDDGSAPGLRPTEEARPNDRHPKTPSYRENNFDALRLLAAIFVIYGHSFHISPAQNPIEPAPKLVGWSIHSVGVLIFFVVSGYFVS